MPSNTKENSIRPSPNLLPEPRLLQLTGGTLSLSTGKLIVVQSTKPSKLLFEAQEAQRALSQYATVTWHIEASDAWQAIGVPYGLLIAIGTIDGQQADTHEQSWQKAQGYRLDITPEGITIQAGDSAGAFYGVMTLTQLLRQYSSQLPCLHIEDYPDFPSRGIMVDISRDKVPTMKTLFDLVDLLAGIKINQLQLYTEHTFAYRRHPAVWANASPMSGEEILQLDSYCRARHVELVPNQNSFGHMTRWLTLDQYRPLADAPNGCDTRWGHFDQPFTLCPTDPGSIKLIGELYEELLPHFTSRQINVGCDETVDLGAVRSKAECEAKGTGRVYLEFLQQIQQLVKQHGRTMQFWGDIIMEHPELVPELPKDVIALEWGYEFDHPFDEHGARFAASGVPFYVCPGTSSWNTIGGRTDNALGNLMNAAEHGLQHGAIGYLITDWGDNGHHQPLPVSYLGYGYGAAVSWSLSSNRDTDIARSVGFHLFRDSSATAGKLAYEIGNVYKIFAKRTPNATAYGLAMARPLAQMVVTTNAVEIKQALQEITRLERGVTRMELERSDADLVKREFAFALKLMRHGVRRIRLSQQANGKSKSVQSERGALRTELRQLINEHKKVWLARNRPGGLVDSVAVLERALKDYAR